MPRSGSHIVNGALLAAIVTVGVLHGRWGLTAGALAVTAFLYATAWLVGRYPNASNAPNQAKYDALPPADKRRVMAAVQRWLSWETAGILTVLLGLQLLGTAVPAGSAWQNLVLVGVLGFAVLSTAAAPFLIWRVQRLIDALHAEQAETPRRSQS